MLTVSGDERPVVGSGRLRDDADFRRYWAARVVSLAGTAVTYVALPVLAYELTGSPLVTALVVTFEALPYLLFGLVAGPLADRWDRRRVMVVADVVGALVLASIPLADALGVLTVPHVLAAAFAVQTVFVAFDAANGGALPALVGRDRVATANSAVWGAGSLIEIGAPAAAGALLVWLTPSNLIALDALTYVGSALLVRSIVKPLSQQRDDLPPVSLGWVRSEAAQGLGFLWRHPGVRTMTIIGTCQSVAGGAFVGQWVVWADVELGVRQGDPRLGVLFAAWAVGGLVATALLPSTARRWGAARVALLVLPLSAGMGFVTPLAPGWRSAALLTAAWGSVYMLVVVNSITYRQQQTPDHLMSRVHTCGRMLSFGLGWPAGAFVGGVVAEGAGPQAGMLAGAAALVVGVVVAWTSPLRGLVAAQA